MDFSVLILNFAEGLLVSIEIFLLTLLFSLPLGLVVAFARMSDNKIIIIITRVYISIMRGTPLMLQLMVVYYGPYYLFKVSLPKGYRFVAVMIGFTLNYAAYFAEIYRGGIESIEVGQYEAARVLGYTETQTFIKIILPQVIKRILPSITNEVITLIKDTSLAFTISVAEMFTAARAISAAQRSMMPFVVAGVFYYIFNFIVAFGMEWIENKLAYYK